MDLLVLLELELRQPGQLFAGCLRRGYGRILPFVYVDARPGRPSVKDDSILGFSCVSEVLANRCAEVKSGRPP